MAQIAQNFSSANTFNEMVVKVVEIIDETNWSLKYTGVAGSNVAIDTDTFSIDTLNNRVGVGTTTPLGDVEIENTASPQLVIHDSDATSTERIIRLVHDGTDAKFQGRDDTNAGAGAVGDILSMNMNTGHVTISNGLTVYGAVANVAVTDLTVADKLIILNDGEAGAGVGGGTGVSGIEVERGSLTNYQFLYDENSTSFEIGETGSLQAVATREDAPVDTALAFWNNASSRMDTDAQLTFTTANNTFSTSNAIISGTSTLGTVTSTTLSSSGTLSVTSTSTLTGLATFNGGIKATKSAYFSETDGGALTAGATIAWDTNAKQVTSVILGAAANAFSVPTGMVKGCTYLLRVVQDGTGSRTATWASTFKWPSGTAPTLSTGANAIDVISFIYDGVSMLGNITLDFQ